MTFTFPDGFSAASTRLGSYYNGDARTPQNPGGFDQYGYVENFVPALRDVTSAGQGISAFADYLNGTVSPLAQAAVDAAAIASAAASAASGAATTATNAAGTATARAGEAATAAGTASGAATTATGAATTATTKAGEASASATAAAGSATTATTKAGEASTSATQAAISANKLSGTSSTSNTIGTGAKTFTTQADKFFGAGSTVTISSDSNPSGVQMSGVVTGYSGTTLTVNAQRTAGTGTYTDWTIRVSGAAGSNGATGWTPVLANVADGIRIVQQVIDWTGGTGGKPAVNLYVSASGLTGTIADATNVRGASGSGSGNVNPTGAVDTNHVALFADATGNLIKSGGLLADVATSGDYADLAGTPTIPTVPGDIGAAEATAFDALVASLADVAITGAYADLSGKPNLGTAAGTDASAYATAAQGDLAETAVQPNELPFAPAKTTAVEINTGTEDAEYTTPKGHADSEAFVTFAANALNLSTIRNGKITLAAITTFAAPTSYGWEGKSGALEITSGGFAGSFNTVFDFGPDGPPTLAAKGYVYYQVKPGMTGLKCSYAACA